VQGSDNKSAYCKRVVTHDGILNNCFINISGKSIHSISKSPLFDKIIKDFTECTAIPGFIDIHTHGYFGVDATSADEREIHKWAELLPRNGVTSFVPTCVSSPLLILLNFIEKISNASFAQSPLEARIVGIRSEGPYISPLRKGAHNPEYIRESTLSEIAKIIKSIEGQKFILDMAPELENFSQILDALQRSNIIVSIGHSDADYHTAVKALNLGVTLMTHFYNAMSPFENRNIGMVGAGFLSEDVFVEIIADLHHVAKEAIEIMIKMKGMDRIIGITDSLSIGGTNKKSSSMGGLGITVKDGVAWVKGTNTIAGSVLSMIEAFKNLYGIYPDIKSIVKVFSTNPARVMGLKNKGYLKDNMDADINFIDSDLNLIGTMVEGKTLMQQ
jgi:N-acetylglucosamine-6-phosphate deacetylase